MSREVASCFIIDDEDRFLIVRRSDTDWWRPLHWEIPGGKIDDTDSTANHAAIREVQEETGLELIQCRFMELYKSERITKFYFISRWWTGDIGIPITQENGIIEHDAYKWASIDDLKNQEDLIIPVEVFERALTK
jgi:8-oxo-dGTP pyrophosphatase MutT (NUDIX family)